MIPSSDLDALLEEELDVFLVEDGGRLEAHTAEGIFSLPLEIVPSSEPAPRRPQWLAERFDTTEWVGVDGRYAAVIFIE
jgi:hypothetical protein